MTLGRFLTRSAPFRVEILSLPYSFFAFAAMAIPPYLVVYQFYCTNILGVGQGLRTNFLFASSYFAAWGALPSGRKKSLARARAYRWAGTRARAHTSLLKHSHAGAYVRAHAYRHARRRQPKSPNLKHIFTYYVSFGDRSRDQQDRPAACLSPKQNWFIPVFPSFQRGIFGAGRAVKTGRQEWDKPPPVPHQAKHEIALLNRQQAGKSSPTRQVSPAA